MADFRATIARLSCDLGQPLLITLTIDGVYRSDFGVYTAFMPCPACGSNKLRLREATGLERLILLFISKRKYRCRECNIAFRAPDRRRMRREKVSMRGKAGSIPT
jgi:hypothetical protein